MEEGRIKLMIMRKAAIIFLILFILYALSYGAGFIAGKAKWVNYRELSKSSFFEFSRTLEYRVPGYGDLLRSYRRWHNQARDAYIFTKNRWGLGTLIFFNNFFVANLTMFVRALFVFPLILTIGSRFLQGVMFAQIPGAVRTLSIFLTEFGGYFFTIGGTLTFVLWTIFFQNFKFPTREKALISGLKVFGLAYFLSGIGILIGSILESRMIFKMLGS